MKAAYMHADPHADEAGVLSSDLPDLSGICLSDLDGIPTSALVEWVRRILDESREQPATYQQYHANI
jgi:FXSXX-COOH protein